MWALSTKSFSWICSSVPSEIGQRFIPSGTNLISPFYLCQVSPVDIIGPCIVWGDVKELVCGKEPSETMKLQPNTSLEKALVLCLCVYYVKDLAYPAAFGQLLGFVQAVVKRAGIDEIPWAQKRLRDLFTKLHFVWVKYTSKFMCCLKRHPKFI